MVKSDADRRQLADSMAKSEPAPIDRPFKLIWDAKQRGLALRITRDNDGESGNVRSYVFFYRRGSIQRSHTIGRISDWTVADARKRAKQLRQQVDAGDDPQKERSDYNAAPTVNELLDRYEKEHLGKKRARRDDESMIKQYLRPALGTTKVHEVEFDDIDGLHRKISAHAPIRANRVVSLASKVFNLAIKWKMRGDNPAKGVERNAENRRERYLTPDEMKRLAAALRKQDVSPTANVVRLALLTGARRGELLKMRWADIDFAQGKWTKPSAHTKQKKVHHLWLSPPALALLEHLRDTAEAKARKRIGRVEVIAPGQVAAKKSETMPSPYVFPARGDADSPQTELKKFWAKLCKDAQLDGVRFHDLRHQHASMIANLPGASLMLIGQLLGHTQPATTARYAHLFPDTQRHAVDSVGAAIEALEPSKPERPAKRRRKAAAAG
jgi:integrase